MPWLNFTSLWIMFDFPVADRREGFMDSGDGVNFTPDETISNSDYVVRIPMMHGVDSLNVAAASAVAFWELCGKK